jgi:hypothetical protein
MTIDVLSLKKREVQALSAEQKEAVLSIYGQIVYRYCAKCITCKKWYGTDFPVRDVFAVCMKCYNAREYSRRQTNYLLGGKKGAETKLYYNFKDGKFKNKYYYGSRGDGRKCK